MEAQKRNKIVAAIGILTTIIIILFTTISCGSKAATKSFKIDGYDETYKTKEEAESALADMHIIDGEDASPAEETDSFTFGSELHQDNGDVLTYRESYDYTDGMGSPAWEVVKATETFEEGDRLAWSDGSDYVYAATEQTVTIPPAPVFTGIVDTTSFSGNKAGADEIFTSLGLPTDTKAIISSPVQLPSGGNGYWLRADGDKVYINGSIDRNDHYDTAENYINNASIHQSESAIESAYTHDMTTAGQAFWFGNGAATTYAYNWGVIADSSYIHIRLTLEATEIPIAPEYEATVPSGWYKDNGDGSYDQLPDNYLDPATVVADPGSLYNRGIYYNTDNLWDGTNVEGWYTSDYKESTDPNQGAMNEFLVIPAAVYEHKDIVGAYTDSVALSKGTPGTWKVQLHDGTSIANAPSYFNTREEAVSWLVDNDIIDYDLIIEV